MLSYRHGFHAGNYADVIKHAALCHVIDYMQRKPGGILMIDSHAGAGLYDLTAAMALKTGEAAQGIQRLRQGLAHRSPADAPSRSDFLAPYFACLNQSEDRYGQHTYPGSSLLIADMLRPQDRAHLFELHPTDHEILCQNLVGRDRVTIQKTDGFKALAGLLPPPERRGLLIMDPPYEVKSDYQTVVHSLSDAYRRFAGLVTLLWYPVVDRAKTEAMIQGIAQAKTIPDAIRLEIAVAPDNSRRGMTAAGVLVINPPFTLATAWQAAQQDLTASLAEAAFLPP